MNFCRVTGNTSLAWTLIKGAEEIEGKNGVDLDTDSPSDCLPKCVCVEISESATFIRAVLSGTGKKCKYIMKYVFQLQKTPAAAAHYTCVMTVFRCREQDPRMPNKSLSSTLQDKIFPRPSSTEPIFSR